MTDLYWLPELPDWRARVRELSNKGAQAWDEAVALANFRLDFIRTSTLDQTTLRIFGDMPPPGLSTKPIRLALLGSATMAHLHAGIRIGGLRRGLFVSVYENDYGQYWQELADASSPLHEFKPTAIVLALDAHHLVAGLSTSLDKAEVDRLLDETVGRIRECWRLARENFRCPVIHQMPVPVH